jgi:hypothetical protein
MLPTSSKLASAYFTVPIYAQELADHLIIYIVTDRDEAKVFSVCVDFNTVTFSVPIASSLPLIPPSLASFFPRYYIAVNLWPPSWVGSLVDVGELKFSPKKHVVGSRREESFGIFV